MIEQRQRPGMIGLAGGGEFTKGYEESDRYLLTQAALYAQHAGMAVARVVILPTAGAADGGDARAARNGVEWFTRLAQTKIDPAHELGLVGDHSETAEAFAGAREVTFTVGSTPIRTLSDANNPALIEPLRGAALIYMVGGDPGYLLRALQGSAAWEACVAMVNQGGVLAGSSAGAMVMGAQMIDAYGGGKTVAGLNTVPDCGVVPHHNTSSSARNWAATLLKALPPSGYVLGVDERTTATVRVANGQVGNTWRGVGRSWTTLYTANGPRKFNAGNPFKIS